MPRRRTSSRIRLPPSISSGRTTSPISQAQRGFHEIGQRGDAVKYQRKDPTKVARHRHFSFDLTFTKLDDDWYAQIVPSWYYSYDGYRRSNWHDDLLSQQKRLEHNSTVRNMVRFVAYFLSGANKSEDKDDGLRFLSLLDFNVQETDEAEPIDDDGEDIALVAGGTAA